LELEVYLNLRMKPQSKFSPKNKEVFKNLFLIVITAIATIAIYCYFKHLQAQRLATSIELDSTEVESPVKEDSVQLAYKKVSKSTFESEYSADSWFSDFKTNKVAFDKNYKDQQIDFYGTITKIKNDYGCASIEIKVGDGIFDNISCTNCPESVDHWSNEVASTAVGREVRIRGIYSSSISNSYTMSFTSAILLNNNFCLDKNASKSIFLMPRP
jgi:hypothetical protein